MNMPFRPGTLQVDCQIVDDPNALARIADYVAEHPDATPFHRPEWMTAISAATGHDWCYLTVEDGQGHLKGLLPLHKLHSALFGRALVSSGFAVGGGILADTPGVARQLSDVAIELAQRHSFPSIELRGGELPAVGWQVKEDAYLGFARDLAEDDEAELLAIPRKQRAEVRKGLKNEMQIRIGNDPVDAEEHYAVYAESVRNLGTPVFPRALFTEILAAFGDDAEILTVRHEERAVASVLSLYHRGVVMPYWGGGTWDARRLRANDVMYYALMNHARERGCTRFDFGRSKVGTGAAAFKKNWGFEPEPLAYACWTADGEEARDVNPLSPKYRMQVALWQRLPLAVANRLGPYIASGLG